MSTSIRRNSTNNIPSASTRLLQWVTSGEFEKSYTKRVRICAHLLMWVILLILHYIVVGLNYPESRDVALAFSIRNVVTIMFFFYFILYFVVPNLILKGHLVIGILCLPLPILLNGLANYYTCVFINTNLVVHDPITKDSVAKIAKEGLFSVPLLIRTLKSTWFHITAVGPSVVLKLVLDIIRITTRHLRMERDQLELELNFLKSQLNPHFLFNTLNNIYTLSLKNDSRASDLILHLSGIMRYTLYESDTQQVSLSNEVEFLKNYVELESVRYGKNADIRFECNEEEIEDQQIAPLLMFPFVENAFKHGQNNRAGQCRVHVRIKANGPRMQMEISNSKNDLPVSPKGVGGIGQANSRKRLELLYPERHTLTIENTADTYKVIVTLILAN